MFDWDWTIYWNMDWIWDPLLDWVWSWHMHWYFYNLFHWNMYNFFDLKLKNVTYVSVGNNVSCTKITYWVWMWDGNFVWNGHVFDMFNWNMFHHWIWYWYIFHNSDSFFMVLMMSMMSVIGNRGSMMILSPIMTTETMTT